MSACISCVVLNKSRPQSVITVIEFLQPSSNGVLLRCDFSITCFPINFSQSSAYKHRQPWERQRAHRPQWLPAFFSYVTAKERCSKPARSKLGFSTQLMRHGRPPAVCLPLPSSDDPANSLTQIRDYFDY
ncbi:hypothetical protein PoB_005746300 [Plakobranchus ocellatus]|uniref:Uncharacterized protein n=1 Tax=Plakobranchus ocellatus TaxID=259542 RepID=A0AAV4CIQ9_9GAST|nr:hypothetical protein PoB_005746300 [Plakobranchus ocellatus]